MRRIAFVSPLGGIGRTTLAAHVAALLAQRGAQTLVIDLSPQNALGLHLGLAGDTKAQEDGAGAVPIRGWRDALAEQQWWGQAALESSHGVRLLPYGAWAQACGAQEPLSEGWLAAQLLQLDLPDDAVIVLDTPSLPAPLALQAAQCADLVLVLLDAGTRSLHWQAPLRKFVAALPAGTQHAVVVTGMDARNPIRAAALRVLHAQWQGSVLPYPVHRDEHVELALHRRMCVHQLDVSSQFAHDLHGVTDWIARRLDLALPAQGAA